MSFYHQDGYQFGLKAKEDGISFAQEQIRVFGSGRHHPSNKPLNQDDFFLTVCLAKV